MLTEPNIDKRVLKSFLEEEFGVVVKNLIFNPKGWASWSYIIEASGNEKYFLKIYKNDNFNPQTFEFTNKLANECGINNISHPLKDRSGNIVSDFMGFKAVLFDYVEGVTSADQKLNNQQLESLGELLSKIHQSKDIIGSYQDKEDFSNPHKKEILSLFNNLNNIDPKNEYQKETKELYLNTSFALASQ